MERMFGSVGFEVRNASLSRMRVFASCERLVRWLRMKPEGMWCFDAVWKISLKRTSPEEQELGRCSFRNLASVSAVKSAPLALRILVYLRYGSVGDVGGDCGVSMYICVFFSNASAV